MTWGAGLDPDIIRASIDAPCDSRQQPVIPGTFGDSPTKTKVTRYLRNPKETSNALPPAPGDSPTNETNRL